MDKKNIRIITVGGGTGGHLFPAMALAEELNKRGYEAHLITDQRCKSYIPENLNIKYCVIKAYPIRQGFIDRIKSTFNILMSIIHSIFKLIIIRPKLVIGFGGYPVFPTLFAARILFIPILIHEQNCFLGKTNVLFAKVAKKIALSYANTENVPEECLSKTVITGNPIRENIKAVPSLRQNFKKNDYFNILIFGGSQGAAFFTNLSINVIKLIFRSSANIKLSITQQAKKRDFFKLKRVYKKLGIKYEIAEFFYDMPEKYAQADLVIGRAGASTISELIFTETPSILIPFPEAMNNHQFYNAQFLEKRQAAWCYEQKNISPEILSDKIIKLYNKPFLRENARNRLKILQKDSNIILADTVEKILQ
jgi:UDP-N-acetylglucosamine--N-acetylmuramyl-(pentapeptide) pyrophosphoryl-undecaprenol N-acetylglucosamine transferase